MTTLDKCQYCGTRNRPVCCSEAERIFKDRLHSLLKAGDPPDAILIEIANACAKEAWDTPQNLSALIGHLLSERQESATKEPRRVVEIHVRQLVPDAELDPEDLEDKVAGKYEVEVPASAELPVAVSIALDEFHCSVAISCLDDYSIACFIDGEQVEQGDDAEYSHEGEALSDIEKVEPWGYRGAE